MTEEIKTPRTWHIKQSLDFSGEPEMSLIAPDGTYVFCAPVDSQSHEKMEELLAITQERDALWSRVFPILEAVAQGKECSMAAGDLLRALKTEGT